MRFGERLGELRVRRLLPPCLLPQSLLTRRLIPRSLRALQVPNQYQRARRRHPPQSPLGCSVTRLIGYSAQAFTCEITSSGFSVSGGIEMSRYETPTER